jgi:hypothetical protein
MAIDQSVIDSLRQKLSEQKDLIDLVMAIFASTKQNTLPKNQANIQIAFYKISKNWNKYFSELVFDISGICPYSEKLDQIITQLETCTILRTSNPSFKEYSLNQDYLNKSLSRYNTTELTDITSIASELLATIN